MAFCSLPPGILRKVRAVVLVTHTHKGKMAWLKSTKGGADRGVIKTGFGTTIMRLDPGPKHD